MVVTSESAPTIGAAEPLERPFTDPYAFTDIRIMKTLKRHGKSHLFEFIRYVAADHH